MKALKIEQTDNSPEVLMDLESNTYFLRGESRPEHVSDFYEPIMKWIEDWGGQLYYRAQKFGNSEDHTVHFHFEYFNSSSAKYIMDLLLKINEIDNSSENIRLKIEWAYDEMDEDIEEAGREFEDLTSMQFEFLPI